MRETIARYAAQIASGKAKVHVPWDGRSGMVLDAASDDVPLLVLSFGIWRLTGKPVEIDTGEREHVLFLVDGRFRVDADGSTFEATRAGGPFDGYPDASRACCVYVPRRTRYAFRGEGEVVLFTAPATADMPLRFVAPGEGRMATRGAAFWRRDVVTLVEPFETSTNLVVGETHSPAGFWSGTPAHVHDSDDPAGGQSDHEEIYCFRVRDYAPGCGPGAVQLLYGVEGLSQAYPVGDWSVVALPGGCHPVVAGPTNEIVYIWGLASSRPQPLRLWDVPTSAFLKDVEAAFRSLTEALPRRIVSATELRNAALAHRLDERGLRILTQVLSEFGFDCEGETAGK